MQPYFLSRRYSPWIYPRTSWPYIRTVSPLDTVRKDDAGRNSIYQRLVNRLVHVSGDGQGCSGVKGRGKCWKGRERERSQWPSGTWRWRPQNENQKLQFIAGTANFPDFTSLSRLRGRVPRCFRLADYPSTVSLPRGGGANRPVVVVGTRTPRVSRSFVPRFLR